MCLLGGLSKNYHEVQTRDKRGKGCVIYKRGCLEITRNDLSAARAGVVGAGWLWVSWCQWVTWVARMVAGISLRRRGDERLRGRFPGAIRQWWTGWPEGEWRGGGSEIARH